MLWDGPAGTASVAGIGEDRAVRVERKRMRKGGNSRGRVCWARATKLGERLHPSTINHKEYFPADGAEELIPFPAQVPTHVFGVPGGINFEDVPLPAGVCQLQTRRAGDSLMQEI